MASGDGAVGLAPVAVDIVYSPRAGEVDRITLQLPAGSRVADALRLSDFVRRHPALREAGEGILPVGVWGRRCAPEQLLRDGDRVELYRPLQVDPMAARRERQRRQDVNRGRGKATSRR